MYSKIIDVLMDTIIDSLKLLPFLFGAFLIIELLEHKFNHKAKNFIMVEKEHGPLIGSLLGLFPQCGFSVFATNLYVTKIISLGTLISIYLSTSDEMLPMLLSSNINKLLIIEILLIKFSIALFAGLIIDILYGKNIKVDYHICNEEHCHCEKGIIKSSLTHTIKIFSFIFITTFILNSLFVFGLESYLLHIFNKNNIFTPFITALIGFIPNCASSVIITELYIKNIINLSSCISGLLTGSGLALIVLFKSNKNIKENIKILFILYIISVLSGIILYFI